MDHRVFEPIVENLKQKNQLTDLESDFIETWNVLVSKPFDADAARQKIVSNNVKYPEICAAITAMPTTIVKPMLEATEDELKSNLCYQLVQMTIKGSLGEINGRRL